jgi:hypothetical protein
VDGFAELIALRRRFFVPWERRWVWTRWETSFWAVSMASTRSATVRRSYAAGLICPSVECRRLGCEESRLKAQPLLLLSNLLNADGADPPRRRWGGNRVNHPASITYQKLGLPVVVATTFATQAFNLTSAHSIDRLIGLCRFPMRRPIPGLAPWKAQLGIGLLFDAVAIRTT